MRGLLSDNAAARASGSSEPGAVSLQPSLEGPGDEGSAALTDLRSTKAALSTAEEEKRCVRDSNDTLARCILLLLPLTPPKA